MPLSQAHLRELQADCLADDLEWPDEATAWTEEDAVAYFESGGTLLPRPVGLEAMELHTYYDMKRHEALGSANVMLAALEKVFQDISRDDALDSMKPCRGALPPPTLPVLQKELAEVALGAGSAVAREASKTGKVGEAATSTGGAATSTGEAATSTSEAAFSLFLNSLGLGGFYESLGRALVDHGEGEGVRGLAEWHARDAKQLQALLAQVGLKVGQRQRLVAALLKEAATDMG